MSEETVEVSLVQTMFQNILSRLDTGDSRMTQLGAGQAEIKAELVANTGQIEGVKNQFVRLNGTVAEHAAWKNEHDARLHEAEVSMAAIAQERARIVGHVQRVRALIEDWSAPVVLVGGVLLTLTNIAMWLFWWMP